MFDAGQLTTAKQAAHYLLGKLLVHQLHGQRVSGVIVEVEAYHQSDPAAHSFKGQTERTKVMFGPAGFAYVYRSYGIHWCMNVTTGPEGEGSAVLLRALEPREGLAIMRRNRGNVPDGQLTNGPGKLTQALGITKANYGQDLRKPPLFIKDAPLVPAANIIAAPRVGISQNAHALLRFYIKGSKFVSR